MTHFVMTEEQVQQSVAGARIESAVSVARARRLFILVVHVCDIMCGASGKVCVDQNGKSFGCPRVLFPPNGKSLGLALIYLKW